MAAAKNENAPDLGGGGAGSNTAVTTVASPGLPAALAGLMEQSTGAGVSKSADDMILPFIALLQDNSPEAKKRDPKYVEGAETGFMLNKASGQLWKSDEGFFAIPVAFIKYIVQWIPREDGGGFVARHERLEDLAASMAAVGAVEMPDPKDPDKTVWMSKDKKYQFIDTRYQYLLIDQRDGRLTPAVISFSSTGHTVHRAWNTLMNEPFPGSTKVPDSWMRRYRVRSVPKKNKKGDFFVLKVDNAAPPSDIETHFVTDPGVLDFAKRLHASIMSGEVRAADEERGGASEEPTDDGRI